MRMNYTGADFLNVLFLKQSGYIVKKNCARKGVKNTRNALKMLNIIEEKKKKKKIV